MPSPTAHTYLVLRAFVDELVRCGVSDAVTSPGSRSTPLVLSLVRDGRLRAASQIDERTAAFHALGLAKATRRPVVLACTSGTAAVEYGPAIVEAREAGVPLIVLTADRPPELREVGAGQTVDQVGLYGRAAKWFLEVGAGHDATPERLRWVRSLACRAVWTAAGDRPGPVHLNWALREPLVLDEPLGEDPLPGRPGGRPWLDRPAPSPASSAAAVAEALDGARRPLIVAGRAERDPALAKAVLTLAGAAGAPLLADPLSGARRGDDAIAHYDALLRDAGFGARLRPDVVLRVGDLPTSKPLRGWLAGLDAEQLAFRPEAVWADPHGVLGAVLEGDPAVSLRDAAARLGSPADPAWADAWRSADGAAAEAIDDTLGEELTEPRVARELAARLPDGSALVVASSMPIRDLETFAPCRDGGPRVLSNRGANGIDGTVATALGVAAAGIPTTLLIGDVALIYDAGSLLALRRHAVPLTVVVLDNGGGGIFDFLAVSGERDAYEEHVATPPELDVEALAATAGLSYASPTAVAELADQLTQPAPQLIHVRTDRAENVALHRRVWAAVAAAVG